MSSNRDMLWDGESQFPQEVEQFKRFLTSHIADQEVYPGELSFHYDLDENQFLDSRVQAYYELWLSTNSR